MKKVLLIASLIVFGSAGLVSAQPNQPSNLKIGYTNVSYILNMMPEAKQIETELRAFSQQLQKQLEAKGQELEEKFEAYERGAATMTETVRANKERELRELQSQLQEFQQNAETSYQQKQEKLIEPARQKIVEAIDAVAKENAYTYILNSDAGLGTVQILLHAPEQDNVTNLVLKKLGVDPNKTPQKN